MDIRFFERNEINELQQSIHDIWIENHIFVREEKLLNYMFFENPSKSQVAKENQLSFLGARQDGKVIGLLGMMPFTLNVYGQKQLGCTLTNWIVVPKYRSSGAGLALLKEVQNLNPAVILSLGITETVAKLYKVMRWNVSEDTPRWIGIIQKGKTIQCLLNGNGTALTYWNEVCPVKTHSGYIVQVDEKLDDEKWDHFYWGRFAKKTVGFARDSTFLQWRYFNHPYFEYKTFSCVDQNGDYQGFAVVRIEGVASHEKIGRIVEMIAVDQESLVTLANAIITMDSEILFYDFYCFSSVSSWGLEAVGFKRMITNNHDHSVFPSRFQPLDLEVSRLASSVFVSENFLKKVNAVQDNAWYITKGDSDQDRPN